jgi:hypothetical protein
MLLRRRGAVFRRAAASFAETNPSREVCGQAGHEQGRERMPRAATGGGDPTAGRVPGGVHPDQGSDNRSRRRVILLLLLWIEACLRRRLVLPSDH